MTNVIAIANQKGGVGKTTTTVNLAAGLAKIGQRVLMIDLDPQGNATMGSGIDKHGLRETVYQVLLGLSTAEAVRQKSTVGGFDILPANRELAGAEIELIELDGREQRLKDALATVVDQYDYVLIDCPPSLGLLTLNALVAADAVLVPLQCEFYALEGLSQLLENITLVKSMTNPELAISTILLTILPSGPTSLTRPLILVASVITPAASAWSISAIDE